MTERMLLKKISAASVLALTLCAVAGCGNSDNNSATSTDVTTATTTDAPTTEEITTTEEPVTTEAPMVYTLEDVNARNEETEDWTEEDWIDYASDMFTSACEVTWDYIEDPIFKIDYNEFIEVDGVMYYESLYHSKKKTASAEYYNIFAHSEASSAKFDEVMIEQDDNLYIEIETRDEDEYYIDTEITAITEYQSNMIFFTASSRYYDPDHRYENDEDDYIYTQDRVFSLKYEEETWKVYDFTLPN